MACDWAADQKHIMSTTVEGMINSTNIDENKMVMEHDTMALTPELPSNIVYSCKSVKNSPHKGNIFTIGAENKLVHVIEYDPSAKFESWRIEIKQKYEGHSAGIRDITFSPDCRRLLTGCEDHSVRLWNTDT